MRAIIVSIQAEFSRYQALAEGAFGQVSDEELLAPGPGGTNSIAIGCWHVAGNLRSRFTEFLTTDGEKPWRKREEEFQSRSIGRDEFLAHWERGWSVLHETLNGLSDADLARKVAIRGTELFVYEALHRSLAHVSYHVEIGRAHV